MTRRGWIGSVTLLVVLAGTAVGLAAWKAEAFEASEMAAASQPEPVESVSIAVAEEHRHRDATTAIGTIMALRSVTLRNEVPGTVERVSLTPGHIVEEGAVLVALDVSVEEAELRAFQAQAALAETVLERTERASESQAAARIEVDRATAERDVALAEIARIEAIIDRKTIRAPFRARVGIADVHRGQYLEEGTLLTTLQGVDDAVHVDFPVAQWVAAELREGQGVEIFTASRGEGAPMGATIVALDARVNPATRNAVVRARLEGVAGASLPAPGSSVRVTVPIGAERSDVLVPISSLRKGPQGDHVFVIDVEESNPGVGRAHLRRVRSGSMLGDFAVIRDGLEAGEIVAASGSFKLREGASIAVAEREASIAGAFR